MAKSIDKWQFGDFQTPDDLANEVVQILKLNHQISPKFIIEPSCGKGAFIRAVLNAFPSSKVIGLDINEEYLEQAKFSISHYVNSDNLTIYKSDFFRTNWENFISEISGYILVIGNPPGCISHLQKHHLEKNPLR